MGPVLYVQSVNVDRREISVVCKAALRLPSLSQVRRDRQLCTKVPASILPLAHRKYETVETGLGNSATACWRQSCRSPPPPEVDKLDRTTRSAYLCHPSNSSLRPAGVKRIQPSYVQTKFYVFGSTALSTDSVSRSARNGVVKRKSRMPGAIVTRSSTSKLLLLRLCSRGLLNRVCGLFQAEHTQQTHH